MTKTIAEIRANARERQKRYRERHPQTVKNSVRKWRSSNKEYWPAYRTRNPIIALLSDAKTRARKTKLPYDLNDHKEEIRERLNVGRCELSGLPFEKGVDAASPYSASIDKKVPSLGYTYSNIRIVCYALNVGMGNWGEEVLLKIVDGVRAKMKEAPLSTA